MTRHWRIDAEVTICGEWWVEAEDEETAMLAFESVYTDHEPENTIWTRHSLLAVEETDANGNRISHEASIDLMARYLIWQQVDVEKIQWSDWPEIGEYDWERIADRFEELAPTCPDLHERQDAYEYLSSLAERESSGSHPGGES